MSDEVVKEKKAVCIQQSEMGDVIARGLSRALEARKMFEMVSEQALNEVSGGISAALIVQPIPYGVVPPPILIGKTDPIIAVV